MKRRHRSLTVSIVWIAILGALLLMGTTSSAIDTANNADDVDVDEQDLQQSCSANSDDMETCVNTQQLSDNEDDNEEDNFEEMNDREQPNEEEEEVDYDDIDTEGDELAGVSPNVWGKPQVIKKVFQQSIAPLLEEIETYMKSTVYSDPQYDTIKYKCRNMDKQCTEWASQGSCEDDAEYMLEACAPACKSCHEYFLEYFPLEMGVIQETTDEEPVEEENTDEDSTVDGEEEVEAGDEDYDNTDVEEPTPSLDNEETTTNHPETQESIMNVRPIPWGIPQNIGSTEADKVQENLEETYKYMTEIVYNEEAYDDLLYDCENRHEDCSFWAATGECEGDNKDYMSLSCAPACHTCHLLDIRNRCPVDPDEADALAPGELNALFERIVNDPYWQQNFGPLEILSSPQTTGGPWIVTLENFLSDEECTRFMEIGAETGYEISMDVAEEVNFDGHFDGVGSEGRTSTNSWCPDSCKTDPIVGPVHERIENMTGLPYKNFEWYQLLQYEPGQFYEEHHDYIHHEWDRAQGPRVLTVFLYLNDVEGGGGTRFCLLDDLTVMPRKGKMLIWPSVLDEDPNEWDERTMHEALEVTAGLKYGANAWIHLRDFKTQADKGCT